MLCRRREPSAARRRWRYRGSPRSEAPRWCRGPTILATRDLARSSLPGAGVPEPLGPIMRRTPPAPRLWPRGAAPSWERDNGGSPLRRSADRGIRRPASSRSRRRRTRCSAPRRPRPAPISAPLPGSWPSSSPSPSTPRSRTPRSPIRPGTTGPARLTAPRRSGPDGHQRLRGLHGRLGLGQRLRRPSVSGSFTFDVGIVGTVHRRSPPTPSRVRNLRISRLASSNGSRRIALLFLAGQLLVSRLAGYHRRWSG